MSAPINDGGPAFPCDQIIERDAKGHLHGPEISSSGLSRRDYFAAKALLVVAEGWRGMGSRSIAPADYDGLADDAYLLADAMVKAGAA